MVWPTDHSISRIVVSIVRHSAQGFGQLLVLCSVVFVWSERAVYSDFPIDSSVIKMETFMVCAD